MSFSKKTKFLQKIKEKKESHLVSIFEISFVSHLLLISCKNNLSTNKQASKQTPQWEYSRPAGTAGVTQ